MKLAYSLLPLFAAFWFVEAHAQPAPAPASSSSAQSASVPLSNAPDKQFTGSVTGTVLYSDNAPIDAARVSLQPATGPPLTVTTASDGTYLFLRVPPGSFTIRAEADGLIPTSVNSDLPPFGVLDLPPIVMPIAPVVTQVNAISEKEAAEAQVQVEEHQRIAGLIPNFFVVYDDNAVPLSPSQKFRLSVRTLVDPSTIAVSAVIAAGEQAGNSFPGFGHGFPSYARRFGASYADGTTSTMLSGWLLPSVLHQDPRFFYRSQGTVRSRIANVLRQAIEQKGDDGRWQFAWSNTLGGMGSAVISTTYYPAQNRTWLGLTAQNFGFDVLGQAIANTLQQFVLNHVTTHRADVTSGPMPTDPSPAR